MQKETLSSFMDGELVSDDAFLKTLSSDKVLVARWHRYHLVRDVLQNKLFPDILTSQICQNISCAIANIDVNCPLAPPNPDLNKTSFSIKTFQTLFGKIAQMGLAACVTLSVIAGVQYYTNKTPADAEIPALNTMPMGISIAPVGGLNSLVTTRENQISQKQHEKIYLLLQDYELQKRLNATR